MHSQPICQLFTVSGVAAACGVGLPRLPHAPANLSRMKRRMLSLQEGKRPVQKVIRGCQRPTGQVIRPPVRCRFPMSLLLPVISPNSIIIPISTTYYPLGVGMDLPLHIDDMRFTSATYSDAAFRNHNYKVMLREGNWTIAVAQAKGVNDGLL
ncbi:hypothetical protein B0J12DRAFT_775406 [Macrophomina phaseolina]|uniref:Uncharacterized protein n=1 Tax=Macrophomina phaseolina TaxID=35725 RepID=A0ABQ8FRN5_9PEZI|nr:hypothetical protein B0J12DRAFT_775406 [Macrophomina phaseolina]